MVLTNLQIYDYINNITTNFININTYIPAKANFFIQKNISLLRKAVVEIEKTRTDIIQTYGTLENKETMEYIFPKEVLGQVEKEMNDLFSIEQNLALHQFRLDDLGKAEFTPAQMQAIMFMIEE